MGIKYDFSLTTKPSTSKALQLQSLGLAKLAVALVRPLATALVLIFASSATFLARLRAVDVHVVWVLFALAQLCPVLAVDVVVVKFVLALAARNRAAHQHPFWIF